MYCNNVNYNCTGCLDNENMSIKHEQSSCNGSSCNGYQLVLVSAQFLHLCVLSIMKSFRYLMD